LKTFKWILGLALAFLAFCLTSVFSALIQSNVEKLAENQGWNRLAIQSWAPVILWLAVLTGARWFWFLFGLSFGVALGMWASRLFPDAKSKITPIIGEQGSEAKEERQRVHSFLKALKPSIGTKNTAEILDAINDEMARLIPPKK
jgi:hypothetical protein